MYQVTPIPAFNDNYIWALQAPGSSGIAVVDPGDAAPVEQYLQDNQLELTAILVTHHHADHTGGIAALTKSRQIPVYGSHNSRYDGVTHPLQQGDSVEFDGFQLQVQEIPGHTLDHISYYLAAETGQLFCGDTLFLAGCGRLFEGSPSQMLDAMQYFRSLPSSTEVYCTHEYSLANLAFASAVEPNNQDIQQCTAHCQQLRETDTPTLPTTLANELKVNPFMRYDQPSVVEAAARYNGAHADNIEVFTAIREWKNNF